MLTSDNSLYTKPFVTAAVFLVAGLGMVIGGPLMVDRSGDMGYYALVVFGIMSLVTGVVVFVMYGALERKHRKLLAGPPLLRYSLDNRQLARSIEANVAEVTSRNKALLFVMLAFCVVAAVIGPFIVEDGLLFALIAVGIGVFLTAAALIITAYRVHKLRHGTTDVIVAKDGVFLSGEFHSWGMPGTALTMVDFQEPEAGSDGLGMLVLEYSALTVPGPSQQKVIVPVPAEMASRMPAVLRELTRQL